MKKSIPLMILVAMTMAACGPCPTKSDTAIETKVVKVTIPDDFMDVPPYGKKLDVNTATQKEVSQWVTDTEGRMQELETRLKNIRDFNNKQKESK